MANVGKLNVMLTANATPFMKALNRAKRRTYKFRKRMREFGASVARSMQAMFRRAAAFSALLAGGVVFGLKKAADAVDMEKAKAALMDKES